jgi:hypothetical protein
LRELTSDKQEINKMDLVEVLDAMDRRYIFLILIIISFAPVLTPLGLPVPVESATRGSYEAMESLQAGDIICITFDYAGGSAAELYPQNLVLMKHALKKNLRLIAVSFSIGGPEMAERCFKEAGWTDAKEYGVDFVNLGFAAGFETAMSAFASNPHSIFITDQYGTPLANIPLMDEVQRIEDIKYLAFTTSTSQDHYIRQFAGHGTIIVGCIQSLYFSVMKVYMTTGQIPGFINGLRGSAEYELLSGFLGIGVLTMDQASLTHLYAVILLIIGNIGFFMKRAREKGR